MEVPPSIGAATASNAGVVTPDAANRSAQSPAQRTGAYTVAQRCGHGFEAGASDAGGVGSRRRDARATAATTAG